MLYEEATREIIGAALEVSNHLGSVFLDNCF